MSKIVVTGANGFVGSSLVKLLSDRGYEVYAVVRHNAKKLETISNLSKVKIIQCDMKEYNMLPSLISCADLFYHFAWTGSAGPLRGDKQIQLNNIKFTCDAIEAASIIGCKRFVMAGSIMEYEVEESVKADLSISRNSMYCIAKKTANYMCRALATELSIDYVCGLISNIYGPGEMSPRLINSSIRKMLKGDYLSFTAGEQIYDFIYITDAVQAFLSIGESGINNKTYYIGSRNPKPLKEFLMELRDVVDAKSVIGLGEIPFNGISLTYNEFDIEAAHRDTGFEPMISFSEGIKRTMDWIKESD